MNARLPHAPRRAPTVLRGLPAALLLIAALPLAASAPPDRPASGHPATGVDTATIRLPVGDAVLELDDGDVDAKLGMGFVLGVRSGARNCYVATLSRMPAARGKLAFRIEPPPGEGRFRVHLTPQATLGEALPPCIAALFDEFYHYADKQPFEHITGTLRFEPRFVDAPPPPAEETLRERVARRYAAGGVVRVVTATVVEVADDTGDGSEAVHRTTFEVVLAFERDGFETTCIHYGPYKVFTRQPYTTTAAGHSCSSVARTRGERANDRIEIDARLALEPEIGRGWEIAGDEP